MRAYTTISILDEDTYVEEAQTAVNTTHIPAQEQTMAATNQQEDESTNIESEDDEDAQ